MTEFRNGENGCQRLSVAQEGDDKNFLWSWKSANSDCGGGNHINTQVINSAQNLIPTNRRINKTGESPRDELYP